MKNKKKGFTLVELLVVIAIIGILSAIVISSLSSARAKTRDSKRMSDLKQLQLALETYRDNDANGQYPPTGGRWYGTCGTDVGVKSTSGATGYIPNLAPTYISVLPVDPKPGNHSWYCYIYISDGADYMLLAYHTVEVMVPVPSDFLNPNRSAEPPSPNIFAVYSSGALAKGW